MIQTRKKVISSRSRSFEVFGFLGDALDWRFEDNSQSTGLLSVLATEVCPAHGHKWSFGAVVQNQCIHANWLGHFALWMQSSFVHSDGKCWKGEVGER